MRIGAFVCLLCVVSATFAETIELPSFGVASVPTPQGWRRSIEPDVALAARWVRADEKSKEPSSVIDIQLYPKRSASNVKQLLQKEAKRFGGPGNARMTEEPVAIGGVEAYEFVAAYKETEKGPVLKMRARFIKHGESYLALVARGVEEKDEKSTTDAFEQIAKEIKLALPTPPSESLRDRGQPIELGSVKLVMDLPDPFRLANDGKKQQEYQIINFANEKTEVELTVSTISTFNQALNDFLPTLGKSLARQFKWTEPPTWNRMPRSDRIEVIYSNLVPAGSDSAGKPTNAVQVILVANQTAAAGSAQMLVMQFSCPPEAAAKYSQGVERMAKSVGVARRAK